MRFVAVEAKTTKRPSPEMAGSMLEPSAGVVPSGVEPSVVAGTQELLVVPIVVTQVERTNTSSAPLGLGAVAPRFIAVETKATNNPSLAIAGAELGPFPGVVPSGVETR